MKKITLFSIGILMAFMTVAALSSGGVYAETLKAVPVVSNGMHILAAQCDMAISGVVGNEIKINPEDFERALNTRRVDYVTVTKLPDPAIGTLYLGSKGISEGQTVARENIHKLSYVSTGEGKSENCFTFTTGNGYEIDCNVYILNSQNYSPVASTNGELSLSVSTHRNVSVYGKLSGYDFDGDEISFEVVKYPENGLITMFDKESGEFRYTPAKDHTGKDSFEYVVRDKYGNYSAASTIELNISKSSLSDVLSDMGGHKAHTSAITMVEKGIMNTTEADGKTVFSPELSVSREEFLVMTMKAAGIKIAGDVQSSASIDSGFADDESISASARGYVALAKQKGIINGSVVGSESFFYPQNTITVAEAAVIVKNVMNVSGHKIEASGSISVFKDHSDIPAWAEDAIKTLNFVGVIDVDGGYVYPNKDLTRASAAMMLEMLMNITES